MNLLFYVIEEVTWIWREKASFFFFFAWEREWEMADWVNTWILGKRHVAGGFSQTLNFRAVFVFELDFKLIEKDID